jgi:hypothetical protein
MLPFHGAASLFPALGKQSVQRWLEQFPNQSAGVVIADDQHQPGKAFAAKCVGQPGKLPDVEATWVDVDASRM